MFKGCARLAIAETSHDEVPVESDSLTPTLSLSFGISCIENALVLLHKRVSDDDDFCQLHQSILLGGAFIALRLKRFSKTAEYAKKCIQIKPNVLASFYLVSFDFTSHYHKKETKTSQFLESILMEHIELGA